MFKRRPSVIGIQGDGRRDIFFAPFGFFQKRFFIYKLQSIRRRLYQFIIGTGCGFCPGKMSELDNLSCFGRGRHNKPKGLGVLYFQRNGNLIRRSDTCHTVCVIICFLVYGRALYKGLGRPTTQIVVYICGKLRTGCKQKSKQYAR